MTIKQYQYVRLAVVIFIAIATSIAINLENFLVPVVAIAIGMLILTIARKKITGILADERDYNIAGTAARYTISVFAFIMVLGVFGFMALKNKNPEFTNIATFLAYLTCALMIINFLIFHFLKTKASGEKQGLAKEFKHYLPFLLLALAIAFFVTIASLRIFTPEDEWICDNGSWTRHGNPDAAMPTDACR